MALPADDGPQPPRHDDARTLALFIERVPDYAIFLLTPEGRVATWNAGAERIKGYTHDEIVGEHFSRFYTAADREAGLPQRALEGAARDGHFEHEGWRVRKDGTRIWAQVTITAVRDHDGELVGFGKVTRDLTERRRTEERLERANTELSAFAAVASHDLAAPLRTMSGFSDLLRRRYGDGLDEQARDYLERIAKGAHRMQALIDDLLEYSRTGGDLRLGQADTAALVADVAQDLGAEVAVGALPTVTADPAQVRQVFHNLIANALKFVDPERPAEVRVDAVREPAGWRFTVADNGIGIAPENAERVFGMLTRLHGRDRYDGSGMGLAICRRIVERHGGTIGVVPGEGPGSVFAFTLPDEPPPA